MIYLAAFLESIFVTLLLVPPLLRLGEVGWGIDAPGPRKVHDKPIPRTGGMAIVVGTFVPLWLWAPQAPVITAVMTGGGMIALMGFADDLFDLDWRIKILGQVAAALAACLAAGVRIEGMEGIGGPWPAWVSVPLTVFAIVGVINALNFSDGLDGLASGLSALVFGFFFALAHAGGDRASALCSVAALGACFGFLRYNTYPAKLFMGDAGSQFCGYCLAVLAISSPGGGGGGSSFLPLLALGVPVMDLAIVVSVRLSRGESPFHADKNHIHHRLLGLGIAHPGVVRLLYLSQWLLVGGVYALSNVSPLWALTVWTAAGVSLVALLLWSERSPEGYRRLTRVVGGVSEALEGLKEKGQLVRWGFGGLRLCAPLLLLVVCLAPGTVPVSLGYFAVVVAALAVYAALFKPRWTSWYLRGVIFLSVPYLVSTPPGSLSLMDSETIRFLLDASFITLGALLLPVVKFTRRQGYKTTPLDFLIVLAALGCTIWIRSLPTFIPAAAKTLILFYACDILFAEIRGKLDWMASAEAAGFSLLALKAFFG